MDGYASTGDPLHGHCRKYIHEWAVINRVYLCLRGRTPSFILSIVANMLHNVFSPLGVQFHINM